MRDYATVQRPLSVVNVFLELLLLLNYPSCAVTFSWWRDLPLVCCHLFVVEELRTSMTRIAMLAGVYTPGWAS